MTQQNPAPSSKDLFLASLAASALVYGVGIIVIAALVIATSASKGFSEAVRDGLLFLGFYSTVGMVVAAVVGLALLAPLGTAFGKLVLRLTPAAWWQGPATGVLVALSLVAITFAVASGLGEASDAGTYVMAAIPVALAPFAGAFVQYRFLRWAAPARLAKS
ncbi:MAG: hypothetical protein AAF697_03810 [Pseudomonadota bacterium]